MRRLTIAYRRVAVGAAAYDPISGIAVFPLPAAAPALKAGLTRTILVSGDFQERAQGMAGSTVPLLRLFDGSGNLVASLYTLNLTDGQLWVQHSGGYHRTIGRLPLKSWAHLELYVATVGSHASTVDVRLNTTSIYVAQGASLGTAGVQTVQIGNEAHAQAFDLLVDNVTVQAAS